MIKYVCLIAYLLVGVYIDNKVVNDLVKTITLMEIMSKPDEYDGYSADDIDYVIRFAQFWLGIVFVIFWPVFVSMVFFNTIFKR